jgi:hypothetical protein
MIDAVLKSWKVWGIPAFVELLAPWQEAITGLRLISDYWQPWLNGFCSFAGAFAAMAAYAFFHDISRKRQKRWASGLILLFVIGFLVSLTFDLTIGRSWFPNPPWDLLVRGIWIIAYIQIFVGSGAAILALLLAGSQRAK